MKAPYKSVARKLKGEYRKYRIPRQTLREAQEVALRVNPELKLKEVPILPLKDFATQYYPSLYRVWMANKRA